MNHTIVFCNRGRTFGVESCAVCAVERQSILEIRITVTAGAGAASREAVERRGSHPLVYRVQLPVHYLVFVVPHVEAEAAAAAPRDPRAPAADQLMPCRC
jgi:hypothetical protein